MRSTTALAVCQVPVSGVAVDQVLPGQLGLRHPGRGLVTQLVHLVRCGGGPAALEIDAAPKRLNISCCIGESAPVKVVCAHPRPQVVEVAGQPVIEWTATVSPYWTYRGEPREAGRLWIAPVEWSVSTRSRATPSSRPRSTWRVRRAMKARLADSHPKGVATFWPVHWPRRAFWLPSSFCHARGMPMPLDVP